MEMFTINVDGSYRINFRKSMKLNDKFIFCSSLSENINIDCHRQIIKGVLVLYLTPSNENTKMLSDLFFNMDSDLFRWDAHYHYK